MKFNIIISMNIVFLYHLFSKMSTFHKSKPPTKQRTSRGAFLRFDINQNKKKSEKITLLFFVGRVRFGWNDILQELVQWHLLLQTSDKAN